MLTPEYLLRATEPAEEIAEQLHQDILNRIIERIQLRFDREDSYILTSVDKWQIQTLQEAGYLLDDIQREIAKSTGYMQSEIAEAMEDAGVKAQDYDDSIYRAAGLEAVPLVQSPNLINIMQRDYEATMGEWSNFTGTYANGAQAAFVQACDKAYHQAMTGAISPAQAVVEALEDMINSGVYVEYDTGRRDTIEAATARAVRTGISQASGHISNARMEEMDWDIVLTSAHVGARPGDEGPNHTNHIWWQGRFFSRTGKTKRFPLFAESTGYGLVDGLCGANCRHSFGPGDGEHNPFDTKNLNFADQHKAYQLQQRQRTLERRIRDTKRKTMSWRTAFENETDPEKKGIYQKKHEQKAALLQKQNDAYNHFCADNNLKKQADRIQIARWDRSQAAKARAAAKRYEDRK